MDAVTGRARELAPRESDDVRSPTLSSALEKRAILERGRYPIARSGAVRSLKILKIRRHTRGLPPLLCSLVLRRWVLFGALQRREDFSLDRVLLDTHTTLPTLNETVVAQTLAPGQLSLASRPLAVSRTPASDHGPVLGIALTPLRCAFK